MAGAAQRLTRDGPDADDPCVGPPGEDCLRLRDFGTGHLVVVAAQAAGLVVD
jgi:hypothetical protein